MRGGTHESNKASRDRHAETEVMDEETTIQRELMDVLREL